MKRKKQTRETETSRGIPLMDLNNPADITQVNESFKKIDEIINQHEILTFTSENGVHSLRYNKNKKNFEMLENDIWVDVELKGTGDVSVSGLTPNVIKQGVTIIINKDGKEFQRITGTFTNDANASSSDLISGRTAYVRGQRITGNISSYSGDRSIGQPNISGSYIYTPSISNGYYSNTRFYFSQGNLIPSNIRQGINIFGVYGDLASNKKLLMVGMVFFGLPNMDPQNFCKIESLDSSFMNRNGVRFPRTYSFGFKKTVNATVTVFAGVTGVPSGYLKIGGTDFSTSSSTTRSITLNQNRAIELNTPTKATFSQATIYILEN